MPTVVSGLRIARSVVTPAGAEIVTREIDFQLSPQGGVEIFQIIGTVADFLATETTDTDHIKATQTLHLEAGSLETVAITSGSD